MTIQEAYTFLQNDFKKKSEVHLKILEEISNDGFANPAVLQYQSVYKLFDASRAIYIEFFNEFVLHGTQNPNAALDNKWVGKITMRKLEIELTEKDKPTVDAFLKH